MNEIKKYPFDIKIYNGLVYEDKQKLDKEEEEYFKNSKNQLMFNLLVSAIIPSNDNFSFVLPSTFGQGTLFGGIDGRYSQSLRKINKEIHKSSDELTAFATLALDLITDALERKWKNQTSVSDVASLMHKAYKHQLEEKQSIENSQNDNTNQLDLNSPYKQISNWRHQAILTSSCSSTPYSIMQCLPEIRPFVLLSQNGQCQCAIPVRYDQTPFRDLGLRSYSSISSAMNFGHVWRNPQSQLFPDYDEFEGNTFRKFVLMEIEEELSETGTLMKIPQHSVMRYHIPVFPLRFDIEHYNLFN
ncbi:MAG: hypothetical protein EZS28_028486 [Streblomastix strix]|uniref:Uncharacterized protein n=1 Tax=Streblomastix strix TaxID=222440 RepID=A0A5J4V057_9EUKA|nr:MAG: hypothetical protein EZS28_028486 [Streblomastix strix]